MALDPESQRLIDLMAAANRPAWNTLSPQAAWPFPTGNKP